MHLPPAVKTSMRKLEGHTTPRQMHRVGQACQTKWRKILTFQEPSLLQIGMTKILGLLLKTNQVVWIGEEMFEEGKRKWKCTPII